MSAHGDWQPEKVRSKLTHPVIDGDGHWIEYTPVFAEKMRKVVGDKGADGFLAQQRFIPDTLRLTIDERKERGVGMQGYWGRQSTNTRDRATAMMPKMLYDRLDELGIDFGIVYPTAGLGIPRIADDETRRAVIRGFNIVTADYFAKLSDRLTPAAVIPMHTPEEAIEELEFVTKQLGAKVGMFGSSVARYFTTSSGSTATMITTWSGANARNSASRRPFTPAAAASACATIRATSPSTISAISPRPATPSPRGCSSAA